MKILNSFVIILHLIIVLCFNFYTETIAGSALVHYRKIVVVITPHPDDAEASCGGLIANYIAVGDDVIILNMTGGEYGIWNKSPEEARSIRTIEAKNAGDVLGANEVFFGGIDAHLNVDSANTEKLKKILMELNPDIVLSSWPMDVHSDHQATGILAWRVFQDPRFNFELFFYETTNTPHTKTFQFVPTHYIDISNVMDLKKEATLQHKSQNPIEWYYMYETLAEFRGYESDVKFAEAYIKAQNSSGLGGRSGTISKTLDNALKQAK
jgi:N-acetylglucosamine malate deacetylase 1